MPPGTEERYCPICEERMFETQCPSDKVQTLPLSAVRSRAPLAEGAMVAERYRVERLLGQGAMGAVYAATQIAMDRRVALKVMVRETLRDGTEVKRFWQEAKNASKLKHPNVVGVYDFGIDEETQMPFIAMEIIEGRTLRQLLADEAPLDLHRTARLLEQVGKALVTAHESGIVHRDLKPDNVMIEVLPGEDEHVTVLDFGIAKATRTPGGLQEMNLTASGVVVGTPRYMSPEQVRGQNIDTRSDLYSLGCIFHEMLTGRPPFSADDPVGLMLKHVNAVRPSLPDLPVGPTTLAAARVLHSALLAQDPEARPASSALVARMLRKLALDQPPPNPAAYLSGLDGPGATSTDGAGRSADVPAGVGSGTGETDTHVKVRPAQAPTPIDSRAFDGMDDSEYVAAPSRPPPARSERNRRLVPVVLLLSVFVGGGLWFASSTGTTEESAKSGEVEPGQAPPEPPEVVVPPAAEDEGKGEALAADTPTPPPEPKPAPEPAPEPAPQHPETVSIRISGSPRGALITDASGRPMGRIPARIEVPWSEEPLRLTVSKDLYLKDTLVVTPTRDTSRRVRLLRKLIER